MNEATNTTTTGRWTSLTPDQIDRLAWRIAERGIAGSEAQLAGVVAEARRAGVRPIATEVLADRTAPDVVRVRAFSLVAVALAAAPRTRAAA